jgi:hypothetical protein
MVAACGAESRISKKYAAFVEETRQHGKLLSPLIGGQLGFVVSPPYWGSISRLLTQTVLRFVCRIRSLLLVWCKVVF